MPRTAIEAVLRAPGGAAIRLISTHLEYYAATQRRAQIGYLRQLQEEAEARAQLPRQPQGKAGPFAQRANPLAAIACGDFNCPPGSDDWREMTGDEAGNAPWYDAWRCLHPERAHPPSVV